MKKAIRIRNYILGTVYIGDDSLTQTHWQSQHFCKNSVYILKSHDWDQKRYKWINWST